MTEEQILNQNRDWSEETIYRFKERIGLMLEGNNLDVETKTVPEEILKVALEQATEHHAEEHTARVLQKISEQTKHRWRR